MDTHAAVGLIGFGSANAGIAAYFHHRGIQSAAWAFDDHPGALAKLHPTESTFRVYGKIYNAAFPVHRASSLQRLVQSTKFLILATRADCHERYVAELEKLNDMLSETVLLVINGIGFTLLYSHRLSVKYLLESNLSPTASGLDDDKSAVNLKDMKRELELSCYPLCYKHPDNPKPEAVDLPEEAKDLLQQHFDVEIVPRLPIHISLACVNSVMHLPPALLNIGRLPDDEAEVTGVAHEFICSRKTIEAGNFYGHWMNTYVNRIQRSLDGERLSLGERCGVADLRPLLSTANLHYGTKFKNLREYSAAPFRHNVQSLAPRNLDHRFYREDFVAFTLLLAIAKIARMQMELTQSVAAVVRSLALQDKPFERCGRELAGFTCYDLSRYGANFPARSTPLKSNLSLQAQGDKIIESFEHIALVDRAVPVVTMFSGGLDSTYLLFKLHELGFTNVHAVAVDVGAPIFEKQLRELSAHFGATFHRLDGRTEFVDEAVRPALKAHSKYLDVYPISSSLSRPVIARLVVAFARKLGAGMLLHTANLSQNSLPRLNNSILRCEFLQPFGSPYVRSVVSRETKARELSEAGQSFLSDRKLSGDENLLCKEFESGPLDDPEEFSLGDETYHWTRRRNGQSEPLQEKLKLTFQNGDLVAVDDRKLPLIDAIQLLNEQVGKFGHGRFAGLEHISTGHKVLEVREAPAAAIIMDALRHLECAVLPADSITFKRSLEQEWIGEAVSGNWGSKKHEMCSAAIASALHCVDGSVTYTIDSQRYFPCAIVADTHLYIRDRDRWEREISLGRVRTILR